MSCMTLVAGGVSYSGWKSIEVTASMKNAVRSFNLQVAEESSLMGAGFWIAPGDPVQIFADGTLILDGYTNDYNASFDANSHDVSISGRGKGQDCVDCSAVHETGRFEKQTPVEIGNALAGKVNNTITTDQSLEKVDKFQLNQGETIFHAVERLARAQGMAVMGEADGSLKITKASGDTMGGMIGEGMFPLLSANAKLSDSKKFSDYEFKSQLAGHEGRYGSQAAHENSKVQDGSATRYRPKIKIMEKAADSQTAQKRADWQARRISGESINVDVECQGWHLNGVLWEPNKTVYVVSPFLKIDAELMIESVTYREDGGGSRTSLKLVSPKAWGADSDTSGSSGGKTSGGSNTTGNPSFTGSDPVPVPTPSPRDFTVET